MFLDPGPCRPQKTAALRFVIAVISLFLFFGFPARMDFFEPQDAFFPQEDDATLITSPLLFLHGGSSRFLAGTDS